MTKEKATAEMKYRLGKSGRSATLIDGSGWDWEYKVCNIEEAQKILDTLR